jgi:hypothetical protein
MGTMKTVLLVMAVVLLLRDGFPQTPSDDFYCYPTYNNFRELRYWARADMSVSDYHYGAGDSLSLQLTVKTSDRYLLEDTAKPLKDHFRQEFLRLLKYGLPFHDTDIDADKRHQEFFRKHSKEDDIGEKYLAYEQARRRSLYGPNPGAVYCRIRIKRTDFPILYEIDCKVVANEDLGAYSLLEEKDLGFSSRDYIEGELKIAMTEQLTKLSETMRRIRACKRPQR